MAKNTSTYFRVSVKQGDRVRIVAVSSTGIHTPDQAKAHVLKMQKKATAQMHKGEIIGVEEIDKAQAKKPQALKDAASNGVSIRKEGAGEVDAV